MKKFFIILLFLFSFAKVYSQDFVKIYESLSFDDRIWILKNYDCVFESFEVSLDVLQVMDSLNNIKFLGGNSEGGKFDAFRHIYWMYSLASRVGEECSRKIGQIYEDYNEYIFYQKSMSGYDSVGKQMDLFNNELGISLAQSDIQKDLIFNVIKQKIHNGEAKVIKKTQNGESLDINNEIIPDKEWKAQWNNRRVLVNSNYDLIKKNDDIIFSKDTD